jgi:hypothetical protein
MDQFCPGFIKLNARLTPPIGWITVATGIPIPTFGQSKMRTLPDIQSQLRPSLSSTTQQELAARTLEYVLDEKTGKSGSINSLTVNLMGVVNRFEELPAKIGIDDLRYRLAHLFMRQKAWQPALDQLVKIGSNGDRLFAQEVDLYSALCSVKLGNCASAQSTIKMAVEELARDRRARSKSVQEQLHDLYEMLVYASDLDHRLLRPYYEHKSTRADVEVQTNEFAWCPVSDYRLRNIVENGPERMLLIEANPHHGILVNFRKSFEGIDRSETVQSLARVLAERFHETNGIEKVELAQEIGLKVSNGKIPDLSNVCGLFRAVCSNESAIEVKKVEGSTFYQLDHPFLLARKREGHYGPSPNRLIARR